MKESTDNFNFRNMQSVYIESMETPIAEGNNDMYKWSDINKALMNAGLNPKIIMKVVSSLKGKEQ
jgi:hypothetical protein